MTGQTRPGRDALGNFFFYLHIVILAFIVSGWAIPSRGWLIFYLVFVPGTVLHWKLNAGACILNNLENWLRYRRWRAPDRNPEEGAWLRVMVRNLTGVMLGKGQMDVILYIAMTLFWLLAWHHIGHFQGT